MVTGKEIEILKARREQMMKEAAEYRRIMVLQRLKGQRRHILAHLGEGLVRVGYGLQLRFSEAARADSQSGAQMTFMMAERLRPASSAKDC